MVLLNGIVFQAVRYASQREVIMLKPVNNRSDSGLMEKGRMVRKCTKMLHFIPSGRYRKEGGEIAQLFHNLLSCKRL